MSNEEVLALVDAMRARGVRNFSLEGLFVEFFSAPVQPVSDDLLDIPDIPDEPDEALLYYSAS